MGKSGIKIALKVVAWIVGVFLALDLLLVGLLLVPPVQTFVVHKVTDALTQKWGTEISIGKIRITPTLKVVAKEVAIKDHHQENMIYSVGVKARLRKLSVKQPFTLGLGDVEFDQPDIVLRIYKGEDTINIAKWSHTIASSSDHTGVFILTSNTVDISHGRFVLINDNERVVFDTAGHPGIDYAFLELADINLNAKDFYLINDDISMTFKKLSFDQYGGFHLDNLSGDFRISDTTLTINNMLLKTAQSDVDMDLCFLYDYWTTYAQFLDSVYIKASIRPSTLSMADIAGFAPAIRGMDEVFQIEADTVEGVVTDFRLQNLKAGWNARSIVQGDIAIRDVIHFTQANFDVDLDSSFVYLPDIETFTLPGGKTIPSNSLIEKVGYAMLDGTFKGSIDEFDTHLWANTGLGALKTNISTTSANGRLAIKGDVETPDFRLAKLLNLPKLLGSTALKASFEGKAASTGYSAENLKSLDAHLNAKINSFHLMGYQLRNINVDGDCSNGFYNAKLEAGDPNLRGEAIAQLDISQSVPHFQGNINLNRFAAGNIGKHLPRVDTTTAKGFEKFIALLQRDPSIQMSFENFQINAVGKDLNDINGYIACDNLKINYKEDSLSNERLRLTAFNQDQLHKFILSSNVANASLESNFPIIMVLDSLQGMAHGLFPSLVPAPKRAITKISKEKEDVSFDYIKFNITTYHTRTLTKLLTPDMYIAPNSTISLDIRSDHEADKLELNLPYFILRRKFRLHNFQLSGSTSDAKTLALQLSGDSVLVHIGQGKLLFDQVSLNANSANDIVHYNLSWHNAFNSEENISNLEGLANLSQPEDIVIQLRPSKIFLKDYECHFNDMNAIHIMPHSYLFDNVIFSTKNSSLTLTGNYDTKDSSRLSVAAKNLDISLLNPLMKESMQFSGWLSADLNLVNRNQRRFIFGKAITDELFISGTRLGDLFLMAGLNNDNTVRFTGGFFNSKDTTLNYEYLTNYSIKDFNAEEQKIADVSGSFENKNFMAKAKFNTFQVGFLKPFLSSFCNYFEGTATGDLSVRISPDTSYIDGVAHVIDAQMGISAIGARYNISDQDIFFSKEGISFRNMVIKDKSGNTGTLSGNIYHKMFKDMKIELQINTDRLLVLDLPHTTNALFYGTGYVQGNVHIFGNTDHLSFVGPDIKTLSGSTIYLQVSSTNSASETNMIHFQARPENENNIQEVKEVESPINLTFDFTFNVTRDADIVLVLESLGGTANARADGRFQLVYDDRDLNLYGQLLLHSGEFKLSLLNAVNSKFTLMPGGSINFDGPLENMTVYLTGYKSSKASMANIIPSEYLSGSADVNAMIHLNGPLMQRIEPTFSFELPNSSAEVRNLFYTAIDTQNTENMTKQFAYFLVTNSFMPENLFGNAGSGLSGFGLLSNMVNNLLSNVIDSKKASFGITYNQATETTSAEYGLKANANLLKDRVTMSTSIGYYDDRTYKSATNNIYGDLTVEYNINQTGTWKLKAYTYIGDRDRTYIYENPNIYTAGVALAYKQDFDRISIKDIDKKANKKSKKKKKNGQQ